MFKKSSENCDILLVKMFPSTKTCVLSKPSKNLAHKTRFYTFQTYLIFNKSHLNSQSKTEITPFNCVKSF